MQYVLRENGVVECRYSVPAGHDDFEILSQYVVLDGLFGAPDLFTRASNAIRHVVGRQ